MSLETVVGLVAAMISATGLLGVAVSLILQTRQTRIAQLQAVRTHQFELFRLAYEYPDLQESWSGSPELPPEEWRRHTYMNLVFMYYLMNFLVDNCSKESLERILDDRFTSEVAREFWARSRRGFEVDLAGDPKKQEFYRVADQKYRDALEAMDAAKEAAPPATIVVD